jgi:hypothetical protein
MIDPIRDLLIRLALHMAYMQGQLEARHELDDPEDYYWYRESVLLRQKVTDALADEPAVREGREPVSVTNKVSPTDLALRVQRLEAMRETEKAALLDAFRQIDELKQRTNFHYSKIYRLEDAVLSLPIPQQQENTNDH